MKTILFISMTFLTSVALAHSSAKCLSEASDADLVTELEARLMTGGSGEVAIANFICDSRRLHIKLINKEGVESEETLLVGSSTECERSSKEMAMKAGSSISTNTLVAICDSRRLHRYFLKPDGKIDELSSMLLGSSTACKNKATEINSI